MLSICASADLAQAFGGKNRTLLMYRNKLSDQKPTAKVYKIYDFLTTLRNQIEDILCSS